jgi:hypothetical protein
MWAQAYFGLGNPAAGKGYLLDYYAFAGPFAERIADANLDTPERLATYIRSYEEAGCDELVLLPTTAELDEVERLANVALR